VVHAQCFGGVRVVHAQCFGGVRVVHAQCFGVVRVVHAQCFGGVRVAFSVLCCVFCLSSSCILHCVPNVAGLSIFDFPLRISLTFIQSHDKPLPIIE
jgi:hypothetical protein